MRNYRHFSSVSFKGGVTLREHGVQTVQLKLQGAPDLHPEEGAGVVHDVHGRAVQQGPETWVQMLVVILTICSKFTLKLQKGKLNAN